MPTTNHGQSNKRPVFFFTAMIALNRQVQDLSMGDCCPGARATEAAWAVAAADTEGPNDPDPAPGIEGWPSPHATRCVWTSIVID